MSRFPANNHRFQNHRDRRRSGTHMDVIQNCQDIDQVSCVLYLSTDCLLKSMDDDSPPLGEIELLEAIRGLVRLDNLGN